MNTVVQLSTHIETKNTLAVQTKIICHIEKVMYGTIITKTSCNFCHKQTSRTTKGSYNKVLFQKSSKRFSQIVVAKSDSEFFCALAQFPETENQTINVKIGHARIKKTQKDLNKNTSSSRHSTSANRLCLRALSDHTQFLLSTQVCFIHRLISWRRIHERFGHPVRLSISDLGHNIFGE